MNIAQKLKKYEEKKNDTDDFARLAVLCTYATLFS
jgi:hypothetical protein